MAALTLAIGSGPVEAAVNSVSGFRDIDFSSTAPDTDVSGTAVINTSGGKSTTGGAFDLGGVTRAGQFKLNGDGNTAYACTLPGTIQASSGGNTADITNFVTNVPLTGLLPGNGKLTITVGATLQLAAGQAAGTYTAALTMTCGTAQGTINPAATVGSMISISSVTALDFGTVAPTGSAGTVTISSAGVRTSVNVDLIGGVTSAARFDISGETGEAYAITLPMSTTLTGPGADMVIDTFVDDNASPSLQGGTDTFNVGATLHVGGSQASGTYLGTFPVTVNYN